MLFEVCLLKLAVIKVHNKRQTFAHELTMQMKQVQLSGKRKQKRSLNRIYNKSKQKFLHLAIKRVASIPVLTLNR